jgi:hypothetical protein
MTSAQFCYWVQGFFELSGAETLDKVQTELLKRHLNLVFAHELDKQHGDAKHQEELSKLHETIVDASKRPWDPDHTKIRC